MARDKREQTDNNEKVGNCDNDNMGKKQNNKAKECEYCKTGKQKSVKRGGGPEAGPGVQPPVDLRSLRIRGTSRPAAVMVAAHREQAFASQSYDVQLEPD